MSTQYPSFQAPSLSQVWLGIKLSIRFDRPPTGAGQGSTPAERFGLEGILKILQVDQIQFQQVTSQGGGPTAGGPAAGGRREVPGWRGPCPRTRSASPRPGWARGS